MAVKPAGESSRLRDASAPASSGPSIRVFLLPLESKGDKIWGENAAAAFGRRSMRNTNSKALSERRRKRVGVRSGKSSNGRTRAKIGSKTTSIASARKAERGNSSPENLRDNPEVERMLQEALTHKNEGRYQDSVDAFRALVSRFPTCAPGHGLLGGILYFELNDPKSALPHFRKATKLAPKSELASLGLFHSLWRLGRVAAALEEIKRYQMLTDWSCKDYLEIMEEIKEKWLDREPRRTLPNAKERAK